MTDIEIANSIELKPIVEVAESLGVKSEDIELYGKYKAKICNSNFKPKGKLILVTAVNPTSAGEGKTTVSIGLADGMKNIGKNVCLALREPSLGPVFGIKGGATGGGYSQVVPMEDINLHFTGDFHAITSANNLLCSFIDNHLFQGNALNIDPKKIVFNRCLDLNDRSLRQVNVGIGEKNGIERSDRFNITAASEIMAILCLCENMQDLKNRLGNILVAFTYDKKPIYARDLKVNGAMAVLLKDAIKPNLVQTLTGTPAFIHGGPFANIAHGCNSIIATKLALSYADYVVTEAGFGADLGAQKFFDTKCRIGNLKPNAVVLVCTIRALKMHGGVEKELILQKDMDALKRGIANLEKHIENIKTVYGLPCVVAINKFSLDSQDEIDYVKQVVLTHGVEAIVGDVWAQGGKGAEKLAQKVVELCDKDNTNFKFSYNVKDDIEKKIEDIAKKVYGAKSVVYSDKAKRDILDINSLQKDLPVIIAKTQYSLSDNSKLLGAPTDFELNIKEVQLRSGAGFVVALAGNMLLMPGLSKTPAGEKMDINENIITGLF
ncbi:MAG: formate--tetrahydrofolate ligase [Clostridia bacterium]|nr:formate--tetrahydrofolate ligase [Clostridia bacterium]